MSKLLVLYYSMYGHIETLAGAVAEGAREVSGVEVTLKRVPELMSAEKLAQVGGKVDQAAPLADPKELAMAKFQGRHVAGIAAKLRG